MMTILSSLSNLSLHSVVFLLLLIYHSLAFRHPLCHDDDRSSLLQLKRSFVFDEIYCDSSADYTKLSSWNVGVDCCRWDGIHCDVETSHVIGLDLSSSCLYGSINSSSPLFRLVHLRSLDLSYNNFNLSTIPGAIKSLSQLKHWNLASSNFIGQIPSEMLQLSNLVSLCLSWNSLILQNPSFKDVVKTFTHLAELDLSDVNISSFVPQSLSNLTSLSSLLLRNCSLLGEFPPRVFLLPNLHVLSLQENLNLTGYLPEFHNVSSPLEELWLDDTNFSGQLPVSVGNLKSLRFFSTWECHFGGVIASSVGNLTNLDYLQLSGNSFSGRIPSSLANLGSLTILGLAHNNFSSGTLDWVGTLIGLQDLIMSETNAIGAIPSSLKNLTQLSLLSLYGNQLTGTLPCWLGNLTLLANLYISYNELNGSIPESMFRLPNLRSLDLEYNNLSGLLKYDFFLQTEHLVFLSLSGNHLSLVSSPYMNVTIPKFQLLGLGGCNLTEFPAFLHSQNELEDLDLSSNNIQGYVPNWLFTLKNLMFLNLAHNYLASFEQPMGFISLPNLTILNLNFNQFKGPLPLPSISINAYNVSQNTFSGLVSPLFCNLTSVETLDLSSNILSGKLPLCFGRSASYLNVRNNSLSGPLPLPSLSIIVYDVSLNNFSGQISPAFCNLPSAFILDLSSNNLSGTLLPCFGNIASVLNLRNNSLSGEIPDKFTSGCKLKMMDLSQNKLEGRVPNSLAKCFKLEILNLNENQMNDVFPSWLGSLPRLRVLSLRTNQFHGTIGIPLTKFEFHRLQIIDISDNNFRGKLPLEYFQNWIAMKSVDEKHLAYMQANSESEILERTSNNYAYSIIVLYKGIKREYTYSIRIVYKGTERAYDKILEFFVVVDLSSNMFEGEIPENIGTLRALRSLNLSNNMLTGRIPSSLGSLIMLEALDLSQNDLSGQIPAQLSLITFLAIFNVSHNSLRGPIPRGNQFDTFNSSSFSANLGLCGDVLSKKCGNTESLPLSPPEKDDEDEESKFSFNLEIVLIGCGTGLVIGIAFGCAFDTRKYEWCVEKKFAKRVRRRRRI